MKTPQEAIRDLAGDERVVFLVLEHDLAWARAGDLLLGWVVVDNSDWASASARAYQALDAVDRDDGVEPNERWSIVLYLAFPSEPSKKTLHEIASSLQGSRKLAWREGTHVDSPFGLSFGLSDHESMAASAPRDVVGATLDAVASGELRSALDVLLAKRRRTEDVDRLLTLLACEEPHEE